jgi:release factor glutamine methyltransferase
VYPPREDSLLLARFATVPAGTRLLEVGAGTGEAARTAARCGARVVATDLNPFALRGLRERARAEGLRIELVRTDLARGLGRFDRVLANPPYLPTSPEQRDPDRWHNLALDGGPDGCRVTARLVEDLDAHLEPAGEAFVVVSSLQAASGLETIRSGWTDRGGTVAVVDARGFEGERLEVWRLRTARR